MEINSSLRSDVCLGFLLLSYLWLYPCGLQSFVKTGTGPVIKLNIVTGEDADKTKHLESGRCGKYVYLMADVKERQKTENADPSATQHRQAVETQRIACS